MPGYGSLQPRTTPFDACWPDLHLEFHATPPHALSLFVRYNASCMLIIFCFCPPCTSISFVLPFSSVSIPSTFCNRLHGLAANSTTEQLAAHLSLQEMALIRPSATATATPSPSPCRLCRAMLQLPSP
jgi:hypothetical protein